MVEKRKCFFLFCCWGEMLQELPGVASTYRNYMKLFAHLLYLRYPKLRTWDMVSLKAQMGLPILVYFLHHSLGKYRFIIINMVICQNPGVGRWKTGVTWCDAFRWQRNIACSVAQHRNSGRRCLGANMNFGPKILGKGEFSGGVLAATKKVSFLAQNLRFVYKILNAMTGTYSWWIVIVQGEKPPEFSVASCFLHHLSCCATVLDV